MIENLINKIHQYFAETSKPDENHIFIYDRKQSKEPLQFYSKIEWQDLDSNSIKLYYQTLPFFTPEALHYFFPAFLLYVLAYLDPNDEVCLFIIYTLSPGKEYEKGINWWKDRFQHFTQEQMSVIYDCLDLICFHPKFQDFASIIEKGKIRLQDYTGKSG